MLTDPLFGMPTASVGPVSTASFHSIALSKASIGEDCEILVDRMTAASLSGRARHTFIYSDSASRDDRSETSISLNNSEGCTPNASAIVQRVLRAMFCLPRSTLP